MGTITMVTSGKGGTGKSTLSVMLAAQMARNGRKSLVLELDAGLRSVDIISGIHGDVVFDISDVLSGRCSPEQAIIHSPHTKNFDVICAPYSAFSLPYEQFVRLCNLLTPRYDEIFIDTSAGLGPNFIASRVCAMRALVVATPDPICLRDARLAADMLFELPVPDIKLIINRFSFDDISSGIVPDLDYCIDTVGVQLIGVVPELPEIALAAAKGELLEPRTLGYKVIKNISLRLLGEYVPLAVQ